MVRAVFGTVPMADGTALHLKAHYPALYGGTLNERNTGMIPADLGTGPRPVAVIMPGINVAHESYAWLSAALVDAGFVAITYGWICEELPGLPALSPGLDVTALKPDTYATRPSATALQPLLDWLHKANQQGPLAGLLDLTRWVLGGHSAGGSVALMNADPDWFAGLRGVWSYGAHSKASTMLGYPEDTVLPLPGKLPTLVIGGDQDGVVAASAFRYGAAEGATPDPVGPLRRTVDEGLAKATAPNELRIIPGANHFSACHPADPATGRPFLDWPCTREDADIRAELSAVITEFCRSLVR